MVLSEVIYVSFVSETDDVEEFCVAVDLIMGEKKIKKILMPVTVQITGNSTNQMEYTEK
jgi:hypothetical protein